MEIPVVLLHFISQDRRAEKLLLRLLPTMAQLRVVSTKGDAKIPRDTGAIWIVLGACRDAVLGHEEPEHCFYYQPGEYCNSFYLIAQIIIDLHNLLGQREPRDTRLERADSAVVALQFHVTARGIGKRRRRASRTITSLKELVRRLHMVGPGAVTLSADTGRLVFTFSGEALALVRFVVELAKSVRIHAGALVQAGFHMADDGGPDDHHERAFPITEQAVVLASLGEPGHLLASAPFAGAVRQDPHVGQMIHPHGRFRLFSDEPHELFSIYDDSVGNASPLAPAGRPVTIEPVQVPLTINDRDGQRFTIRYAPHVRYTKAVFEFDTSLFCLLSGGSFSSDNAFVYEADKTGSRDQVFEIWLKRVEHNSRQPFQISFRDGDDRLMAEPAQYIVRLTKPFSPSSLRDIVSSIGAKAWELAIRWFWHQRWYIKPAVVLGALVFAVLVDYIRPGGPTESVHHLIKQKLHVQLPLRNKIPYYLWWSDESKSQADLSTYWTGATAWLVDPNPRNERRHMPVTVKGPSLGLVLTDPDYAFYDFALEFKMIVTQDQRSAAWVVRATGNDHYLFVLKWPEGETPAQVDGCAVRSNECRPLTRDPSSQSTFYRNIRKNDTIHVLLTVKCFQFRHVITLVSDPYSREREDTLSHRGLPVNFGDWNIVEGMRSGGIGFGTKEQLGEMRLESVQIRPTEVEGSCRGQMGGGR